MILNRFSQRRVLNLIVLRVGNQFIIVCPKESSTHSGHVEIIRTSVTYSSRNIKLVVGIAGLYFALLIKIVAF